MRIRIDLELQGEMPRMLPASYQPEFSSWIYKTLHFGSDAFSQWLKQKGYLNRNNEYDLYTFSNLMLNDASQKDDRLVIHQEQTSFFLSFLSDQEIEPYIKDLFLGKKPLLGDKKSKVLFHVNNVEKVEDPVFNELTNLSAISPVVITRSNPKKTVFLSPEDKDYGVLFIKDLMARYALLIKRMPQSTANGLTGLSDLQFRLLDKPKGKVVKVNSGTPMQENIKGYLFNFSLKAPAELIRFGYYAGFGTHCPQGFGCCQVKE